MGASIPSSVDPCGPTMLWPGFDSQAQHVRFFNLYMNCDETRLKIKQKRPGLDHYIFISSKYLSFEW